MLIMPRGNFLISSSMIISSSVGWVQPSFFPLAFHEAIALCYCKLWYYMKDPGGAFGKRSTINSPLER